MGRTDARPLVRLDPFPPVDDYRTLRPSGDRRVMPTIELLPMVSDGAGTDASILAIVFPYTPVGCETSLVIELPDGGTLRSVTDLWSERDWTDRAQAGEDGVVRIPLVIPGDLELLALKINYDGAG